MRTSRFVWSRHTARSEARLPASFPACSRKLGCRRAPERAKPRAARVRVRCGHAQRATRLGAGSGHAAALNPSRAPLEGEPQPSGGLPLQVVAPRTNFQLARVFGMRIGVGVSWFVVLFLFIIVITPVFHDQLGGSRTTAYLLAVASVLSFFASLVLHVAGTDIVVGVSWFVVLFLFIIVITPVFHDQLGGSR